jgi:oligopeptide/dipeptide ABC transporter ATP-binding protein
MSDIKGSEAKQTMAVGETLLKISDLRTHFDTESGVVKAVDGVSFRVRKNELFALVGESGCGKSITALSIMRLIPCPPGKIVSGSITLDGVNLFSLSERKMQDIRGSQISMIFQEPMTSLNPVFTCGSQIVEAIQLHRNLSHREAKHCAIDMLAKVGIPEPVQRFSEYPHQLSGGMQQRVMIAIALACNPKVLIADEPTTALDVTIQAQILDLLKDLQRQGQSILLITHDLGVVAESADTVGVMYASGLVELADVKSLFAEPLHPYTHGLFRSLPRLGEKKQRLDTITGNVPSPLHFPSGCKFHPRCTLTRECALRSDVKDTVEVEETGGSFRVLSRCAGERPALLEVRPGHWCACWETKGYAQGKETDPSGS